ncbi:hypothetical protein GCM10023194_34490 [Planotetraspora phitsanulokensis]|uniref:MDMPI C-terminal domain-containing protein n=1 Tax=Planotetraspora phitsanulokensis TaxID=575192 RepID=A0A8J3U1W7_9ACTN|nr:hypothetical protein Pph01_14250 [Planotetraspora phitsanulokensis]
MRGSGGLIRQVRGWCISTGTGARDVVLRLDLARSPTVSTPHRDGWEDGVEILGDADLLDWWLKRVGFGS